jgi:polysaccharide export outer membrane protein
MYITKSVAQQQEPKGNPWSITAARDAAPGMAPGVDAAAAPSAGALIPITPELIKTQRAERLTKTAGDVSRFLGVAQSYKIAAGDVLSVIVWDHPELNASGVSAASSLGDPTSVPPVASSYNVSDQGLIQFPYAGVVKLAGLTEYEARDLLVKRLSKYFKDPQVTLRVQAYRAGRVYVDGEVRTPGLQAVNDVPMTLPELIGRAGGLTPIADRSTVAVTRDGVTSLINLAQIVEQGFDPNKILLRNGDLVRVASREEAKVFVLGEILRPMTQTLRDGRLTLNEALGDSGGVSQITGDPKQIYIVRPTSDTARPEIYHLDASTPIAYALADGFGLQAHDVIYVDPVPLVRWNRVISLILPSAQVLNTGKSITN